MDRESALVVSLTNVSEFNVLNSGNRCLISLRIDHNMGTKQVACWRCCISSEDYISGEENDFAVHGHAIYIDRVVLMSQGSAQGHHI